MKTTKQSPGSPCLRLAFLVSLLAAFPAQGIEEATPQPYGLNFGQSYRFPIKDFGLLQNPPFTKGLAAQLNEDPDVDVVVLRGQSPYAFLGPTSWDAVIRLREIAYDIAILKDAVATGRDELLTVSDAGLRGWTRLSNQGSFESRDLGRLVFWVDSKIVGTADMNGDGLQDIFGAREAGDVAMVLHQKANGTFSSEFYFGISEPAQQMIAADVNGDGWMESVVLSAGGLYIYNNDGTPRAFYDLATGLGSIAVLKATDIPEHHIAWVAFGSGVEDDLLYVLDDNGLVSSLNLGPMETVSISTGDLTGDDWSDLVLSRKSDSDLLLLENLAWEFSLSESITVNTGAPPTAPTNLATPVIADLDDDRDRDIFFPVQETEEATVLLNLGVDHRTLVPKIQDPVYFNRTQEFQGGPVTGWLQLEAELSPFVPEGVTHIELLWWRKQDLETHTNASPFTRFLFPIDSPPYSTGIMELEDPNPSLLFWLMRYVVLDEFGGYVRTFPSLTYAFTTECCAGELTEYLADLGASVYDTTDIDPEISNMNNNQQGSETVSTILSIVPIPDFDDDDEPESGQL